MQPHNINHMLCPKCKNEIDNGSVFCEHCGEQIKKSKKVLWISIAAVCVAVFAILIVVMIQRQQAIQEARVAELEQQVQDADINQSYHHSAQEYEEYVDLGLPSGTLWKQDNEYNDASNDSYFTFEEAVWMEYGPQVPSKEQWDELREYCDWQWTILYGNYGYYVVGSNGNSIFLPAAGYRSCFGGVDYVGTNGYYWSSTPNDSYSAWYFAFDSSEVSMHDNDRCYGFSVRLVQ